MFVIPAPIVIAVSFMIKRAKKAAVRKQKCGSCGKKGHNARTCGK